MASRIRWAAITLPDGRRVCRSSGTAKRQEAQEWLDRTRADLWRVHRLGERPTYTWQDAVVRWSEDKADKATALEDRVKFLWLDGYLSGRLLHTITRDDVQAIGAAPRWPLQIPPSVARSNSPRRDDRNVRIVTRNRCPLQDDG